MTQKPLPECLERDEQIDWTGFGPDNDPIEPLTPETFVARLNKLTDFVNFIEAGRRSMKEQLEKKYAKKLSVPTA